MKEYNEPDVIEKYYQVSNILSDIGIMENIPEELKHICMGASREVAKIINFINEQLKEVE